MNDEQRQVIGDQIERDDPALTKLIIGREGPSFNPYNYRPHDCDWEREGNALGKNTHIEELVIKFSIDDATTDELHMFCRGLSGNKSIEKVVIERVDILNDIYNMLGPFFEQSGNIQHLVVFISRNEVSLISSDMVNKLSLLLKKFNTLKEFRITARLSNDAMKRLINSLGSHTRMTKLNLGLNRIGRSGMKALASLINSSSVADINLWSCGLTDETAVILSDALLGKNSVQKLNLAANPNIRIAGWGAVFDVLQSPSCLLENLRLYNGNTRTFSDVSLTYLTGCLAENITLKCLDLNNCEGITDYGWRSLGTVIENSNSTIEVINLSGNSISSDVLVSFANSMSNNKTLKGLYLGAYMRPNDPMNLAITSAADSYARLLCNDASIMDTYNSNHTLGYLIRPDLIRDRSEDHIPPRVLTPLHLNRNDNKAVSARRKIINSHFSGAELNMQPFIDMDLEMFPHVIAWMARDEHGGSLLYQFLRGIAPMLDDGSV